MTIRHSSGAAPLKRFAPSECPSDFITAKHTPGPWTVESDGFTLTMRHQVVATAIAPDGASVAEQRANARLIAAAPEMYEALTEVLRTWDCIDISASERIAMRNTCIAALAKARGEA